MEYDKKYIRPEMEVITFCDGDLIRTSGLQNDNDNGNWVQGDNIENWALEGVREL